MFEVVYLYPDSLSKLPFFKASFYHNYFVTKLGYDILLSMFNGQVDKKKGIDI